MEALRVARYIINKCIELEKPISNLPLQKIIYFVHIGFLKKTGKQLITDKDFEAWQWGPVIRDVYHEYRIFGSNALSIPEEDSNLDLDKSEKEIVDKIIDESTELPPWELVKRSHNPQGAWIKVYKEGSKNIIPSELIEEEAEALENE
ncbi:type II toxin-antitoxin system antitoxin SocA domain-containing protein [Helicobacter sp. 13S00477-4]|uniref:Panacea domain-containing protein n=1 Tax=Helicobacter sp. 13S00477-4 TaxID=1905759 RepID=UPI000BA73288|nr:type II toxin-antitoxin system antitoxin SocA domain-containing protein [Helicobacter sp. 13S00477-4]PAF50429.1 hypothetical protein BKH44_08330 [Helicobacter sp. 13S00477-4]